MNTIHQQIQWLLQEKYHGKQTQKYQQDIERLTKGEPVDYVIGFMYFLGCKIDLSKRRLIPRVETEYWTEQAIEDIRKDSRKNISILDMFSGSGAIGISIMRHLQNTSVTLADADPLCTAQAKINAKLNKLALNRYHIITSNIFEKIKGKFHYIVANPPYIPTKKKQKIQKSVLAYEPHLALFGGEDGLLITKQFLQDALLHLHPRGKIYMEFDTPQKKALEHWLQKCGYRFWKFHKDQYGKWRYLVCEV